MEVDKIRSRRRQWLKLGAVSLIPAVVATSASAAVDNSKLLAILTAHVNKLKDIAQKGSAGLYQAGNAPGVLGRKASQGCIGEYVAASLNDQIALPTNQIYCAGTIQLSPGLWQISVGAAVGMGAGAQVVDWLVELGEQTNVFENPGRRGRVGAAARDVDLIAPLNTFVHLDRATTLYLNTRATFFSGNVYWSPRSSYFYAIRVG